MAELTLARRDPLSLWQIALWPGAAPPAALATARPGIVAEGPDGALARVGPLKWWLIDGPQPSIDPALGAVLDLSCEQAAFRLGGPRAADLLARIVAVDLRARAFPPGGFAATGGHHMMLKLRRHLDDAFTLYAMRSYADFLHDILREHGRPFGLSDALEAPLGGEAR